MLLEDMNISAYPIRVLLMGLLIGLTCCIFHAWFRFEYPYLPKGLNRIPSPPSWPIFGHSGQLSDRPQRELKAWADRYGELFQLKLGLHRWIYINSVEASREIMERQVAHTSSRIPSPISNDVIGGDMRFVLMPSNAKWNLWRKVTHKTLTPTATLAYLGSQDLEATQLVYDCLMNNNTQGEFYWHVRRFATSVIMAATYGWRVPSTWWRRSALKYYAEQERAWMAYWSRFKINYEAGKSPNCFAKQLNSGDKSFTELEKAFLAGTNVEAGAESISTTLNSTLRYLALHPDTQAAAHAELDQVVGRTRPPTWDHQSVLPRIHACIRETGRLRPPTTNGVIHYTTADISYAGFHIPAGSVVAMNQYALYYDPTRFPQPEEYIPERWLVAGPRKVGEPRQYTYSGDAGDLPDRWLFGAGKRICVGMHLSINSMFIALAKLLWAFEIRPAIDEQGREILLDTSDEGGYIDGRFTVPREFKLRFVPRFEGVEEVIRNEWEVVSEAE